jgi:hypothetical protein
MAHDEKMTPEEQAAFDHSVQVGYEESDVPVGWIAWAGFFTVVLIVVIILAMQAYFDSVKEQQIFVKVLEPVSEDYQNVKTREDQQLFSYSYQDREKGTVRLPIERAKSLLLEESQRGEFFYNRQAMPVKEPYSVLTPGRDLTQEGAAGAVTPAPAP